ncbi:MAG: YraN family protein [Elusimicrobiaceae bacterium]|nr:YraN family protein [Elusimicrobiaceae bacterium]
MTTRQTGQAGEAQAAAFLEAKGYQIVARNFLVPGGELDLVAYDKKTLVFVEVKKRASTAFGGPVAAVTRTKQKRVALAALQFLKAKSPKFDSIRFDVICVLPQGIEHILNAFSPERTTM